MKLEFKLLKAMIIKDQHGPDHTYLHVDCPSTTPNLTSDPLSLCFKVAADGGEAYLTDVLGIPSELIEVIPDPCAKRGLR